MGIFGSKNAVSNASGQSGRQSQQSQARNQVQAATVAGRGRRRIGGGTSTRKKPSRSF